jgi:hypothetical protein
MQIDTAKLKVSTKAMLSFFVTVAGVLQIPAVNQAFTKVANAHPRIAPVVGIVVTIWTLLHDPQVAAALGIRKTLALTETTEEVALAENAEVAK